MKLNLTLSGSAGTISVDLDREFQPDEIESLTTFLSKFVEQPKQITQEYKLKFNAMVDKPIVVIKILRHHLGCGLKEAKDYLENVTPIPPMNAAEINFLMKEFDRNHVTVGNYTVEKVSL